MTESVTEGARTGGSGAEARGEGWQPHIVALVCNWCSYAGADMAGTIRLEYPASVRLVRFPCTGRMSPLVIIKAFEQGADGVLVSGCHPGDCHYVQGNLVARRRFTVFRSLMDFVGLDMKRLHFAWVSAAEGHKWARVVGEVTESVHEAGPLPRWNESADDGFDVQLPPVPEGPGPKLTSEQHGALLDAIRSCVREMLESGEVGMAIGYAEGSLPGRCVPAMVESPGEAATLSWGEGCTVNLANYLPEACAQHDKVAVVIKQCDVGAVAGLVREGQLKREDLVMIGVRCTGVSDGDGLAAKCGSCSGAVHSMCDVEISPKGVKPGAPGSAPAPIEDPRDAQIAYLEGLSADDRWRFWQRQFGRCLRCYACRGACPLCYCESCISEKHRPQWISPIIDNRGNTAWNIIRAVHLAGRCTGCDECARACPADIKLDLINRKLVMEVERQFGEISEAPDDLAPMTEFRMEDPEGFIL
jgi:coenzyme F420-reducing hydrogenase delta subunit/ferredoxin